MRQYITLILTALLLNIAQAETSNELANINTEFNSNYNLLFSDSLTKADFVKYFNDLENKLNKQYEAFLIKEGNQLTKKGNDMALALEMLEPLNILANGKLSTEACTKALHNNELNSSADESTAKKIGILINKLCQ